MVEAFGKPNGPRGYHLARACTLGVDAVEDFTVPARLAERELSARMGEFYALTERGAMAYRIGDYQAAVNFCEKSLQVDSKPGRAVVNWLWLALAHERLGKSDEARRWLNMATAWLDQYKQLPDRAEVELGLHPHNWLEALILRREAEALIPRAEKQ